MRKSRFIALALVAVVTLVVGAASAVAEPVPVEPGNAKPANFEPASACGCHSALVEQWQKSLHAQALTDPIYVAKLEEAKKANPALGPFCNKCHGPAATMTGEAGAAELSVGVADGITCAWCHQVTGNDGKEIANTSQLVLPDGTRRAQIKDPQAPHKAAYSEFHESPEFCGGCHNVNHPINGMHLEATYSEYIESPWAKEGVTCQDCHMSLAPGTIGPYEGVAAAGGPKRGNIYSMSFVGANVELGDAAAATALLKSAAELDVEVPEIVGGGADVKVTITNVGAGHHLPTGLTEVREMWLEVSLIDGSGNKTPVGERRFGTILQDDEGNAPVELWEATKIKSDDRIPARESVTETYRVTLPDGVEAATLEAALRYRSTDDELPKKAGTKNPVTDMAVQTTQVYANEAAQQAASKQDVNQGESRDSMNLAIALVGLAVIAGIIVLVVVKSRKPRA